MTDLIKNVPSRLTLEHLVPIGRVDLGCYSTFRMRSLGARSKSLERGVEGL